MTVFLYFLQTFNQERRISLRLLYRVLTRINNPEIRKRIIMINKEKKFAVAIIDPQDEGTGPISLYPFAEEITAREFYLEAQNFNDPKNCWFVNSEAMALLLDPNLLSIH